MGLEATTPCLHTVQRVALHGRHLGTERYATAGGVLVRTGGMAHAWPVSGFFAAAFASEDEPAARMAKSIRV